MKVNGKVAVNLLDLGLKVTSKYEVYKLLKNEGNLYLHSYKECSIEFSTDYLEGKKSVSLDSSSEEACITFRFSRHLR